MPCSRPRCSCSRPSPSAHSATSRSPRHQSPLALVIGADNYQHVRPLQNAVNDANDLAAALTRLGSSVHKLLNPDQRGLEIAIGNFVGRLQPGDVALFHFSGHGIQVDGENYLVPVDFDATREVDAKYDSYPASRVREHLEESQARLKIIILDACRNNAFGSSRSASRGLAQMTAGRGTGTYIAFSTAPGSVADDNPEGRNGLFTSKLLEALEQPGIGLDAVFVNVRAGVYEASGNRQMPWSNSSVLGEFYFRPPASTPAPPAGASELEVELAFWSAIKDSANPGELEAYLSQYPSGRFAPLARVRLDSLRTRPPSASRTEVAVARPAPSPVPPPIIESDRPPRPRTLRRNPRDGLQYVWIPPGEFQMGCSPGDGECDSDEKPRHPVRITNGFWIGQTEVTVAAYERFARSTGQCMPPAPDFNSNWTLKDHPINRVTWNEAKAYCDWIDARLPTEAEWEYAARAGSAEKYHGELDSVAWYRGNSGWKTHPVGGKAANAWGLHDMLGNAWEWGGDWYDGNFYGKSPGDDPAGPPSGSLRVLRGGSWDSGPGDLRLSLRLRGRPGGGYDDVGFRCVGE